MNKYNRIIKNTLEGKETGYRYPGEILERCVVNTPEKANEVLEGFLDFTSNCKHLEILKNTENAFNSNQIDMFVNYIGNYKAEILKFLLTGEISGVKKDYLNSVESYAYLGKYIKTIKGKQEINETLLSELTEEFSNVIHLMKDTMYDEEFIGQIVCYINCFELDSKYTKEDKKYLSLVRKATENVLSDADIEKLQGFGYSLLGCRKLNALNLDSYVSGREDRAWFYFLKEAFFGTKELSEKEKELISEKIEKRCTTKNDEKIWALERVINCKKNMLAAISIYSFAETSVNASFCLSFMSEYNYFHMVKNLSFEGNLFNTFTNMQKETVYSQCMKYSDDDKKLLFCKKTKQDSKYLFDLSADRILILLDKGILNIDELDTPNVYIKKVVRSAFCKVSRTAMEVLKRYANKAPDILDYMDTSYYHSDADKYFSVKGEDFSEDEVKELYTIKENYFFKYAPFLYERFILSVIKETKTLVHSKEEWLSLLEYMEEDGSNLLSIKREFMSEDEYAEIIRKQKEKEEEEKRNTLIEEIKNATCADDIGWWCISKDMPDVKYTVYLKICELRDFSCKAERIVNELFEDELISDEEFLKFYKGKKELKKQSKEAE